MAVFIDNPSFPDGLNVIAIDHDTTFLNTIEEMCNRCHYQVTKCNTASEALNLLERKDCFDVMLIDAHMPNMDAYDFVQHATGQLNIPVISNSVTKSITYGACEYWTKPLYEEQFKIMWQHVARKGLRENKKHKSVGSLDVQGHRKRERDDDNVPNVKKPRLMQFKAKPKVILKRIDIHGLSAGHVASHLQKYRNYLKRSIDEKKCGKKKSKPSDDFEAQRIDRNQHDDVQDEWIDQDESYPRKKVMEEREGNIMA
ncbi:response regulator receiver domain protein [Medicago truncatula]|uniref:Response regulator receiver domain protein n=1 Tax=Medicago truncatula TaxID=3880 RepID=G7JZF6_MEDTR|nr:response regulator receiver domain protein [Medicago truncatula]